MKNFIYYITSNNVILSEQLSEKIFRYYNRSQFGHNVNCETEKIIFFINNNIQIKTYSLPCQFPEHMYNDFITLSDLTWMNKTQFYTFLCQIKWSKTILSNNNINKLIQYNQQIYTKVFNK